jgi:hypothetical protein
MKPSSHTGGQLSMYNPGSTGKITNIVQKCLKCHINQALPNLVKVIAHKKSVHKRLLWTESNSITTCSK